MTIRQVITFRVRPGTAPEFIAGFTPIMERVRLEDGCEQYELYVSHDRPEVLVMLERWRDLAALDAALKRQYKGPNDPSTAFLADTLDGPPVRERYEV